MSTAVTRFEVIIPYVDAENDTVRWAALQTFLTTMQNMFTAPQALYTYVLNNTKVATTYIPVFGYILVSQQAAALAALNTLITALAPIQVTCVTWSATLQP